MLHRAPCRMNSSSAAIDQRISPSLELLAQLAVDLSYQLNVAVLTEFLKAFMFFASATFLRNGGFVLPV